MRAPGVFRKAIGLAGVLAVFPLPGLAETPPVVEIKPPPQQAPILQAPQASPDPPAGKGRIALALEGNRRWCTYPDDRVMRPPARPAGPPGRGGERDKEVFTFGYQFVVAAVKRGAADVPLILYESPVIRTASWRPISKVGSPAPAKPKPGQRIAPEGTSEAPRAVRSAPDRLVPYWHEVNRCATLPSLMEFDLDPGTYDLYLAFDLLNRQGGWVHRSTAYLTDVPVQTRARTRVDGRIHTAGGGEREVELIAAGIESAGADATGAGAP